ncbi:MAG: glucose-6-phosphate dehydrogenase [Cyanobacteria bacterium RYN_339]|nr:glucose-6-phosphate dehydrogenase [Cyanobacteria bacterium RYN_339]
MNEVAVDPSFHQGTPHEVPPGKIEDALREIWRAAAAAGGGTVSRACLLTLAGYAANPEDQDNLEAALDMASRRMPSRTLLLVADVSGPDNLRASINTNFHEQDIGGGRQLYSEEVHLHASGKAVRRLPSLLQTLRVTDVPAVLYWPGRVPLKDDPGRDLLVAVDRLIVDSRDYMDAQDLCHLYELVVGRLAVGDLTWQRLTPWRTLIAHLFDGPPFADHVLHLDRVTLTRSGAHPAGTFLMAGWLASRLGWHSPTKWECDDDSEAWHLIRPDGKPVVLIIRSAPGFHEGLNRVGLESSSHERPVSIVLERGARLFKLRGTGLPARSRPIADMDDDELLVQALRSPEEDHVITQALAAANALLTAKEAE